MLDKALEVFFALRATPRLRKKPSTSELIDWICALKKAGVDLAKVGHGIPFLGTLLKNEQRRRARRQAGEGVAARADVRSTSCSSCARRKVPVSTHEWMALMEALALGLHERSLDGFYHLAARSASRTSRYYDAFDEAFLAYFKGVDATSHRAHARAAGVARAIRRRSKALTDEQREALEELDLEKLRELFEERLQASRRSATTAATAGSAPAARRRSARGGTNPTGMRVGGGGGRSAMAVADERRFKEYRRDVVLDVRQIDVALRGLRRLVREGADRGARPRRDDRARPARTPASSRSCSARRAATA